MPPYLPLVWLCRKERGYLITTQNRNGGTAKTELIKFKRS